MIWGTGLTDFITNKVIIFRLYCHLCLIENSLIHSKQELNNNKKKHFVYIVLNL